MKGVVESTAWCGVAVRAAQQSAQCELRFLSVCLCYHQCHHVRCSVFWCSMHLVVGWGGGTG